ncbi:hypothetical protein J0664_06090 [Rhizobium leguminosarum]|uniref:hypothetical protein n=1 Tax=Rhizobium leguminosarum TaxID=384 RepID=UPI001A913CD1|nr:hypothetical protein [Rhizobium leguminosarum]MBY5553719.1 hypothetical protein [Rhizobium leguminosarum]QSW24868.1 hypothetical protein J0664_06090 [Rhizobium leguminosarum]
MVDIVEWPLCLLTPSQVQANVVAFTRSGGRSLGGVEPVVRTDLGYWAIDYSGVVIQNRYRDQWRTWQAIRQKLGGRAGLVAVRVPSSLTAPYVSDHFEPMTEVPHDDDMPFDDDAEYAQGAISILSEGVTPISSTSIALRVVNAGSDLVGARFSYNHALYEIGPVISIDGDVWTVPISPSVRELIPGGAALEFDQPTCLCHLAEDRGMDVVQDAIAKSTKPNISFIEATDYWNSLI